MEIEQPGASTFLELSDVPHTYAGAGTKAVTVNAGATALEFTPGGSSGTVTDFIFTNANGVSGIVATSTTTPTLTLTLGAITPSSVASTGAVTGTNLSGTNTGDQTNVTGNAGTVTVADAGADTTTWVLLATDQTGSLSPRTDAGITYDASANALSTTTFIGALTGTASGNEVPLTFGDGLTRTANDVDVDAAQPTITSAVNLPWTGLKPGVDGEIPTFDSSGNPAFVAVGTATHVLTSNGPGAAPTFQAPSAGIPTQITVADTTAASTFVALFESATGNLAPKTDAALTYNATNGALAATTFNGVALTTAGSASTFLNGTGAYSTPAGGSGVSIGLSLAIARGLTLN